MVEYSYAWVRDGGRMGLPASVRPRTREQCMSAVAKSLAMEGRAFRCDRNHWLPVALFPGELPWTNLVVQGWEFCPVWVEDRIVAVILRREIVHEESD